MLLESWSSIRRRFGYGVLFPVNNNLRLENDLSALRLCLKHIADIYPDLIADVLRNDYLVFVLEVEQLN